MKLFIALAIFFLLTLSLLPTYWQYRQTPPNHTFMFTHNNSLDYPMFLGTINRGQRGQWLNKAVFTSEPQPGSLVHWIYIPLAKVTAIFGLDARITYQLGRIIFGTTLALSTYYFISTLFGPKSRILALAAFLLSLFAAGFSRWATTNGTLTPIGAYLGWWTGGDVLIRATFQPHAMLKNTLLLAILTLFATSFRQSHSKIKVTLLSLLGLILALHDPMNSLSIWLILTLYTIFELIKHKFKLSRQILHTLKITIPYLLASSIAFLATFWAFKFTPWQVVSNWESRQFYPVDFFEYANHLGPIFYLGIPGMILLLYNEIIRPQKTKPPLISSRFLVTSTALLSVISLFFILSGTTRYLGLSTLRFFQTPIHIFLSLSTVYLFAITAAKIRSRIGFFTPHSICLALTLATIAITTPAYLVSLRQQSHQWQANWWPIYPDTASFQIISRLRSISHIDDVVFSNDLVGQIVPAISGNPVYIGHPVSTIDFDKKYTLTKQFFAGKLTTTEAFSLLISSRAKYILTLYPEEISVNENIYPFLVPIAKGQTVSLYSLDTQYIPH